jgi:hypothetical protein
LISEGRLAFTGRPNEANNFFNNLGFVCPSDYNPADYFIKTLSISPYDRESSLAITNVDLINLYFSKLFSRLFNFSFSNH